MQFIPHELIDHLEFSKLLELLAQRCITPYAQDQMRTPVYYTDSKALWPVLVQVDELRALQEQSEDIALVPVENILEHLDHLKKPGFVLEISTLLEIQGVLQNIQNIWHFIHKDRENESQALKNMLKDMELDSGLHKMITRIIDEDGEVLPSASPALSKIIRSITSMGKEAHRMFTRIAGDLKNKGLLSSNAETIRNGRRVLSVPAENKRRIKGIILDESASGKTVFIEPQELVGINNGIMELELDKRREILRIIRELCDQLRPHHHTLELYFHKLVEFDLIRAKAHFSREIEACLPVLTDEKGFLLTRARHPILYLKNKRTGARTVPFELELNEENRIAVISGPNAGGKSITLKAVGLIQLMLQIGCLVPVGDNAKMGIFQSMYCDIGDHQSLEDDLSTYSSRLQYMKAFMHNASPDCLILIDEFGSGTDPNIGGAIAEGILKEIHAKRAFGIITTHYSNIKVYAHQTDGIINGSMVFDHKALKPSYKLDMGKPGSSFAFEIARKAGIPKSVIQYARKKAGKNTKYVDDLLVDLQSKQKNLEDKISQAEGKEKRADQLVRNYERLLGELDIKRRKLKLQKKYQEIQAHEQIKKGLESHLRQLTKEKNDEKVKHDLKESKNKQKKLQEEAGVLKESLYKAEGLGRSQFKKGDYVKLRTGNLTGQIQRINKKKVDLLVGNMKMSVPLTELLPAKEPLDINTNKGVQTHLIPQPEYSETKLDIRGYRKDEAIKAIEMFMDQALIQNQARLEILHGKGNGVLKKTVHQKLAEYKEISAFRHPEEEFGGTGITIVML